MVLLAGHPGWKTPGQPLQALPPILCGLDWRLYVVVVILHLAIPSVDSVLALGSNVALAGKPPMNLRVP